MTLSSELRAEYENGLLVLRVMKPGTLAYETQHRKNELLHRAADALEWRGIESAPKDGCAVLLTSDHVTGALDAPVYWGGTWDGEISAFVSTDDGFPLYEATHWRPLPATPEGG